MAELLVPNDGVRGVDVQTEKGTVKYNANKAGVVEVDNSKHVAQMLAEGFTRRATSFGYTRSRFGEYRCKGEKCFYLGSWADYECPKCGFHNKPEEVEDGERDKSD